MFKSIKKWIKHPIMYEKFLKRDGAGDSTYEDAVSLKCYVAGKVLKVTSVSGEEVLSTRQLYFDGNAAYFSTSDKLTLDGSLWPIHAVQPLYDSLDAIDMWVVYV